MNKILRNITSGLSVLVAFTSVAITPQEVNDAIAAAKDSPKNHSLNLAAGDALKDAGRYTEAIPYYLKSGNAGNLGMAESYFYLYDYDKAEELLDKYVAKRTKAEEEKDMDFSFGDGTETIDWAEHLRSRIELGRSMLDRVERIQVIDSINVPADKFFRYIRLAKSAGSLKDESILEEIVPSEKMQELGITGVWAPAYVSENGDDVIWYGSNDTGESRMYESTRLTDGTWDTPTLLFDFKKVFDHSNGSWVSHPFLMSDGVTLYFAADGEDSLGELDIFISRRDENGFLQPSNIGMPYNSPYNDFLYAIDEETGAGWWVSDRNQIEDSVTIYTFVPQDLRINYPVETANLTDFARLKSIADTQDKNADYSALRKRIASISDSEPTKSGDSFEFAIPGIGVYTSLSDFKNAQARDMMRQYIADTKNRNKKEEHLSKLRKSYHDGDKSVSDEILSLEKSLETEAMELKRVKNQIIKLESY